LLHASPVAKFKIFGGFLVDHLADDQPVEQFADCGEVLLDRRRAVLVHLCISISIKVETWCVRIAPNSGIVSKRADAPYTPGTRVRRNG
jgi:hypothetical protein